MKPRGRGLGIALMALLSCGSPLQLAGQKEGTAIRGLDGALYDPYSRGTVERTQQALRGRGLYAGPIHGILDPSTMQAIYAFQKASHHLQMCGVPTPRTRLMLEQGSHTDPN